MDYLIFVASLLSWFRAQAWHVAARGPAADDRIRPRYEVAPPIKRRGFNVMWQNWNWRSGQEVNDNSVAQAYKRLQHSEGLRVPLSLEVHRAQRVLASAA